MSTEETPDPIWGGVNRDAIKPDSLRIGLERHPDIKWTVTEPATRIVSAVWYYDVPGNPPRPTPKRGFIAWVTRANRRARRQWRDDYLAWVKAGKPQKTIATTVPASWLRKDAK